MVYIYLNGGSRSGNSFAFSTYEQRESMRHAANELFGKLVIKKITYTSFELLDIAGPDLPDNEQKLVAYELIKLQAED